ncbi:DUF4265 domain-containing protein [Aeoliella mucimassa]|uniref:DUF4265 domain-containing protein n=1 Tax=Aeoliella mucimassa TaxID=2527972 RepID=A0A518AIB8_9BACT|nr:DUF4265 domain-containing protein [Aeoliella mucimassa]QDU54485.1 hypothetical protein Pan181_06670 [Aeoliella mucimassa]
MKPEENTPIKIIASFKDGKPVHEEVPAAKVDNNHYRLLASPGFAPGVASGDEIAFVDSEPLGYRLIKRAGNVCVQMFLLQCSTRDRNHIASVVKSIGGWVDGGLDHSNGHLLILTFPVLVGFESIEQAMARLSAHFPDSQWMYGNVYELSDGTTPLNWWL